MSPQLPPGRPLPPRPSLEEVMKQLGETKSERHQRIKALFNLFDTEGTGMLTKSSLEEGFKSLNVPSRQRYAFELLCVADTDNNGQVDEKEFRRYLDEKETELLQLFRQLDVDGNNQVDPGEVDAALQRAGIHISSGELARFMKSLDKNKDGHISFKEWRDFFVLFPRRAGVLCVYQYWQDVAQVDVGLNETVVVPDDARSAKKVGRYKDMLKSLLAGGIAGAVSRTATAPLDRVKTIMQVEARHYAVAASAQGAVLPRLSIIGALQKVYKTEGLLGFFRGNGMNVLQIAPKIAVKLSTYDLLKPLALKLSGASSHGGKQELSSGVKFIAGGLAGVLAQTAVYPLEVLKTRLQTHASVNRPSAVEMTTTLYRTGGLKVFFRGLGPSLMGMFPYAAIDLALYDKLKGVAKQANGGQEASPLQQLCCGMVSGAVSATTVYPLNLIRTRLQASLPGEPNAYNGLTDACVKIYRQEGLAAFYRGMTPNLMKVVPAASISYVVYEDLKKRFRTR